MRPLTAITVAAGITTATLIGLKQTAIMPHVMEQAENIAVTAGIIQRRPCQIIIGLDITAGREKELAKDKRAIEKMINDLGPGDKLSVYLIHSMSESDQEEIIGVALPENIGPMGQVLYRAKADASKEWSNCWQEIVMPLISSDEARLRQRTDLFGFLRFIAHQKKGFLEEKKPWIILFTDGQHVGDGFNMEKRAPREIDLEKAEQAEFIPALNKAQIAFLGMTPTHHISNEHWRQIQKFWKAYGNASGAKYTSVSSERNLSIR